MATNEEILSEIKELKDDIKDNINNIHSIKTDIAVMKTHTTEIKNKIEKTAYDIYGNGVPGLKDEVSKLKIFKESLEKADKKRSAYTFAAFGAAMAAFFKEFVLKVFQS